MNKLVNNEHELLDVLNDNSIKYFDIMLYKVEDNADNKSKYLVEKSMKDKYKMELILTNYNTNELSTMGYFMRTINKIITLTPTFDDWSYNNVVIYLGDEFFNNLINEYVEVYVDEFLKKYNVENIEDEDKEEWEGNYAMMVHIMTTIDDIPDKVENYKPNYRKYLINQVKCLKSLSSIKIHNDANKVLLDMAVESIMDKETYINRQVNKMMDNENFTKTVKEMVGLLNELVEQMMKNNDAVDKGNRVIGMVKNNPGANVDEIIKEIFVAKNEYAADDIYF